ncbi:hypothetical protein PYCC9005_002276 [Savitreella phatthalungensis]
MATRTEIAVQSPLDPQSLSGHGKSPWTSTAIEAEPTNVSVQELGRRPLGARLVETARNFWHLGFTAFGGPGVHVVILKRLFVGRWLDETTFADLFALGNALPGPGSTQLAFSIAVVRNGTLAGLLAFLFWSLPGAAGMAGLGAGVRAFPEKLPPIVLALLTGLNASAVGLIALAAYQLSLTAVTDPVSRLIVLASASFGICYHAPWMYPVLIVIGGLCALVYDKRKWVQSHLPNRRSRTAETASGPSAIELDSLSPAQASDLRGIRRRNPPSQPTETIIEDSRRRTELMVPDKRLAVLLGVIFVVSITVLLSVRGRLGGKYRPLDFFANMTLAGLIIFGGGPVVIPLLRGYTVDNGWVHSRDFLLGFAILQAFPGPNFNFAVYLGVLAVPSSPALGGFLGWLGIFLPGILLKLSLLPGYTAWRKSSTAKSILRGFNAAATGLVYTAVWQLFLVGYIYTPATGNTTATSSAPLLTDPFWGVVAGFAFVLTQWYKSPPALTIVAGALAGLAWYGVVNR